MAWTTPRTWVGGEIVTAALLNSHLRDNLNAIVTPTSYTPTWGNTGTANTLGNGTITGTYLSAGKRVKFQIVLTWGSTTSSGSGSWTFTLPATASAFGAQGANTILVDTGTGVHVGKTQNISTTVIQPVNQATPVAGVTATAPFTWANTDVFNMEGEYLAA